MAILYSIDGGEQRIYHREQPVYTHVHTKKEKIKTRLARN